MKTSLAPDSPLAEAILEPKTCRLLQEELKIQGLSSADIARTLGMAVPLLDAAMTGQCALKIAVWKAIGRLLKIETGYYNFRPSERHDGQYWELYNVFMVPGWRELPLA